MVRILVTGGIGCGKSYVISVLNAMGIPSFDSDAAVKRLYDEDAELLNKIKAIVGDEVVSGGRIDRKYLAGRIFNDGKIKREVEDVVFPAVIADFERWCGAQESDTVLIESAIALENEMLRCLYDKVLVVTAPLETRIERAMRRDGAARSQIEARINSQWGDEQRCSAADYIVNNDSVSPLLPQLEMIMESKNIE